MSERSKLFWVRSMYGAQTRQPIVVLTLPGGEMVQMVPEDARALALNLLQGAEAAEQDAFLVEASQEILGFEPELAVQFLAAFRAWRAKGGPADAS
jgi:hypothetical protein